MTPANTMSPWAEWGPHWAAALADRDVDAHVLPNELIDALTHDFPPHLADTPDSGPTAAHLDDLADVLRGHLAQLTPVTSDTRFHTPGDIQ